MCLVDEITLMEHMTEITNKKIVIFGSRLNREIKLLVVVDQETLSNTK